ncbi:MAG: M1 family aminopeptidase [Planctomycetota bacterium]
MTDHARLNEMGIYHSADFTMPGAEAHYPPDLELEPVHLDIALRVDVAKLTAEGGVTSTIRANRTGASKISLHAADFEDVDVRDADGGKLTWNYDGKQIHVEWDDAFEHGDERKLVVRYKVEKPVTGLFFSNPTKEYPDAGTWAATDHETERARHWLPCIDLPNVRPTLSFHLTADKSFTILANGELVKEEEHDDGTKTAHWELKQRCPSYLTCFALGDFTRCDDGEHNGKPIAYFSSREFSAEDLKRTFGRTGSMLDWITKKLDDPFPFPKYFQFALPGIGGAMENISLVSWDDMLVLDETLAKEWTWQLDQINLHEMAHTWFGDHIVCRDFAHAWLKESWAVYTETCYLEDTKGAEERDYDFFANLYNYIAEADGSYVRQIATRVFDHSWSMYDRHLYPGGAVRLHMLRHELGDETFWAGTRDYVKKFGGKTVETDDFRRVMEEHSGRSLVKWFDQWIFGKGYPSLKVSFSYDAKKKEGTFEIEQKQSDKKKGVPLFDFVTDLGWVIDGKLNTREVRLERDKHAFTIKMDSDPEQVRLDPNVRTVCKIDFNPGDDKLRKQLTDAEDVVGRILAAQELCKTGKRKNIEAVRDAYRKEKFWGVRVRMAGALGGAASHTAVEALADLLGVEQDGMVCETLVRAAGKYRDPLIREALQRFLEKGPQLYRARGAAWEALGAQRQDAPFEQLIEAAKQDTPLGWEQQGALRSLAETRDAKALPVLLEASKNGATSNRARHVAALALGTFAHYAETHDREQAVERLKDLLRDPTQRVQKMAVAGLRGAGATEALGAIQAYGNALSEQEQTDIKRAMAGIRASAKPKSAGVDKQLDEFRETVRKLNDRIEKLESRLDSE